MTWDVENAYGWSSKQECDSNRLKGIEHYRLAVSPAEADIWFRVVVQRVTPGTEVRGRIVGPRCLFTEMVEVVSRLRSVKHKQEEQVALLARTAFPEPGYWDPHTPLLYRVVVELWQDGQRCEVSGFDLGFRMTEMGSGNVFVNQKPFFLPRNAKLASITGGSGR
jgi:Glycosyl hydrolases family 2